MPYEIEINDEMWFGAAARKVSDSLAIAAGQSVLFKVSSIGGSLSEGIEIYNSIRDYKKSFPGARCELNMGAICMSAMAYVAACPALDIVRCEDNTVYMIHNASTFTYGDSKEHRKQADILKGYDGFMSKAFADKSSKPTKEIQTLMGEETYYFGQEIMDNGFADEVKESGQEMEKMAAIGGAKNAYGKIKERLMVQAVGKAPIEKPNEPGKPVIKEVIQVTDIEAKAKFEEGVKAGVTQGIEAEKRRVGDLMALKDKPEFSKLPPVIEAIDKGIKDGLEKAEVMASIMAVLSNGNIQAALESPGAIGIDGAVTASGEAGKVVAVDDTPLEI
jgi:ATP-dependent protease ClpP protease subunit